MSWNCIIVGTLHKSVILWVRITYLQVIWLGNGSKNEAQLHTIAEVPPVLSTMGSEFHWCPSLPLLLLFSVSLMIATTLTSPYLSHLLSFRSQETHWENKGVQPQDCSLQWERDLWSLQWRKRVHFRETTREDRWYGHGMDNSDLIFSSILTSQTMSSCPFLSFQPQPLNALLSDRDRSL